MCLDKDILSEYVFFEKPIFFFCFISYSEVLVDRKCGVLGFFFPRNLTDYNPILFCIPGIVYFCFLPKRKGRLQARRGRFGSSPGADGVSSQKLQPWQQTRNTIPGTDPGMVIHHSCIFSTIESLSIFIQSCHVSLGMVK